MAMAIFSTSATTYWFTAVICLSLLFHYSVATSVSGYIEDTPEELRFVQRFAFVPEKGLLKYKFVLPAVELPYKIALLSRNQHLRTSHQSLTCQQKLSSARLLQPDPKGCVLSSAGEKQVMECEGEATLSQEYFIYLTSCDQANSGSGSGSGPGIHDLSYTISMTNGGNPLTRHFSADHMYTLETDMGVLGVYLVLLIAGTCYLVRVARRRLAGIIKLLYASLVLQTVSVMTTTVALALFARDGRGRPIGETAGQVLSSAGTVVFAALIVMVAKGHSITQRRLDGANRAKLVMFVVCETAAYILTRHMVGEGGTSPGGEPDLPDQYLALIIVQAIGGLWLLWSVYRTLKLHRHLASFYLPFLLFYLVWFVVEPASIIVAFYWIPTFAAPNVSNGIHWLAATLGHAFFMFVIRPHRLKQRFPYSTTFNKVHVLGVGRDDGSTPRDGTPQPSTSQVLVLDLDCDVEAMTFDLPPHVKVEYISHESVTHGVVTSFPGPAIQVLSSFDSPDEDQVTSPKLPSHTVHCVEAQLHAPPCDFLHTPEATGQPPPHGVHRVEAQIHAPPCDFLEISEDHTAGTMPNVSI